MKITVRFIFKNMRSKIRVWLNCVCSQLENGVYIALFRVTWHKMKATLVLHPISECFSELVGTVMKYLKELPSWIKSFISFSILEVFKIQCFNTYTDKLMISSASLYSLNSNTRRVLRSREDQRDQGLLLYHSLTRDLKELSPALTHLNASHSVSIC